ncbi:hypothetical protein BG004_006192 [Podila humilis]|nr:hypothetical protein BG004_006192 [Podila humilis]
MVKFTSVIATIAAITVASMATAAPVDASITTSATPTLNDTTIATKSATATSTETAVPTALPAELFESKENDTVIRIASKNDPFSTSVTHRGKATWFTHSYGSCNYHWNGNKEPVVALSAQMMGAQSWGNPFCGRRVRVVNQNQPDRFVVARIVDKCPGDECAFGSLDLSPVAFKSLGHLDTGILDISWNFI